MELPARDVERSEIHGEYTVWLDEVNKAENVVHLKRLSIVYKIVHLLSMPSSILEAVIGNNTQQALLFYNNEKTRQPTFEIRSKMADTVEQMQVAEKAVLEIKNERTISWNDDPFGRVGMLSIE